MKVLLDTHMVFWWMLEASRVSPEARAAIETAEAVYVSAVSAWEMATKVRIGKWPEVEGLSKEFSAYVRNEDFSELSITVAHANLAGSLIGAHRDPFDRLLAAQALLEGLTLLSVDPQFEIFKCTVIS